MFDPNLKMIEWKELGIYGNFGEAINFGKEKKYSPKYKVTLFKEVSLLKSEGAISAIRSLLKRLDLSKNSLLWEVEMNALQIDKFF